jgi:hypothetical protein
MENCQGEDLTNPKNALCAQDMERFTDVRIKLFELPLSSFVHKFGEK